MPIYIAISCSLFSLVSVVKWLQTCHFAFGITCSAATTTTASSAATKSASEAPDRFDAKSGRALRGASAEAEGATASGLSSTTTAVTLSSAKRLSAV